MRVDEGSAGVGWFPLPGVGPGRERMADRGEHQDERLVALALEGRRDAWDALIARHDRRVLMTLLARGVRIDRARDITQETWARLIEHQRAGRLSRLDLPGLAIRQALFLSADEGRRAARQRPVDDPEELALLSDPATTIEERLVARSQLERASAELDRCPRTAQRVFELVYEEPEMSHAQAAERVGLSVQRVRQTLCEVRARLRAALEDDRVHVAFARNQSTGGSHD